MYWQGGNCTLHNNHTAGRAGFIYCTLEVSVHMQTYSQSNTAVLYLGERWGDLLSSALAIWRCLTRWYPAILVSTRSVCINSQANWTTDSGDWVRHFWRNVWGMLYMIITFPEHLKFHTTFLIIDWSLCLKLSTHWPQEWQQCLQLMDNCASSLCFWQHDKGVDTA